MKLAEFAYYVTDRISSNNISLSEYVTTDCILQNKGGREIATNLPPKPCSLTHYQSGDVLVANIRPYLKKVWFANMDGGASSDVLVFRAKEGHSSSFLYAVLLQDSFFDYVMQGAKGSKMPRGDKEQILRYEIPTLSCLEESVGTFFLNIDYKIRLNKQINQNLEAMAKQLYDYWFVQFDFPNEEGKPYKSSGGKMVWNEKLNQDIPETFSSETLGKTCDILLGGTPSTGDESLWGEGYNWLNSGEVAEFPIIKSEKTITEKGLNKSATVLAQKGSVTLSITRYIRPSILGIDACINQSVVAILENKYYSKEFLYPMIANDIPRLMKLRSGANQPHINKDIVEKIRHIVPLPTIMKAYVDKVKPIYDAIIEKAFEIENLTKQRDQLLPLLMNGQVSPLNSD